MGSPLTYDHHELAKSAAQPPEHKLGALRVRTSAYAANL